METDFFNYCLDKWGHYKDTLLRSRLKNKTYEYEIQTLYKYENLTFKLPKNYYELIDWGDKLKICLDSYVKVHNKRYLIFGVFKGNKLIYAINFDKERKYIIEAKGFANSNIFKNDMKKIEKFFEFNF